MQSHKPLRVLLADDSLTVQKVVELTFMDVPGINVTLVGDGIAAIAAIASNEIDLIIADVHMPKMSGYEVAAFSKLHRQDVPVLLLVGAFEQFDEAAFAATGADGVLEKPFTSHELYEAVITLLRGDSLEPRLRVSERRILEQAPTTAPPEGKPPALSVFLCHATHDKQRVRELASKLRATGFEPWLDEEKLLPGQQWELEITGALRGAHAVLVCLSTESLPKVGYVQKEIAFALDLLAHQPEGEIFLIPLQLEPCEIPQRLSHIQVARLFEPSGYDRLVEALNRRATKLGLLCGR